MAGEDKERPDRFLPGDPHVAEPYRLTPQLALRLAVLGFVALGVFALLFLRLWAVQVLSGTKYLAQAAGNRVRTVQIDAPRGAILDSTGHVLVKNTAGTRVELWLADMPKRASARRRELASLAMVTNVKPAELNRRIRENNNDALTPVVVKYGATPDQISYLKEHQLEFPGVRLDQTYLRKYPHQSLAAQILGYVGPVNEQEYKAAKKAGDPIGLTDTMGQAGIESTYDKWLRGTDGLESITVDAFGHPTKAVETTALPKPGYSLRLTLDLKLQRAAEQSLSKWVQRARSDTDGQFADGGAIVALRPSDGAVLAMASYPTYKPSDWQSGDPKKLAPLLDSNGKGAADNYPSLNRAIDVGYPPGSTWKPLTALAGMQENILSPYTPLLCSPTYTIPEKYGNGQVLDNWTPDIDQLMTLKTALTESCDTYFYRVGYDFYQLPPDRGHPLQDWASRFGFGTDTGIDLGPEDPGLVPTPEWRKSTFTAKKGYGPIDRVWKPGYSVQLAIGQGDLLVTPLQMARFYAAIANGGKLVTPYVGEDIEQPSSNGGKPTILQVVPHPAPKSTGVDPSALQIVRDGLLEATQTSLGTSYGVFGQFPELIAGKTGTAQKVITLPGYNPQELNQSWWCGYGPFDAQPADQIVVCAVIENGGHGGTAAAPAALGVFEKYFGKTATTTSHPSD